MALAFPPVEEADAEAEAEAEAEAVEWSCWDLDFWAEVLDDDIVIFCS